MRKTISLVVLIMFIAGLNAFAVSKNEPLKKLSIGLDNVAYGGIEIPDSINETSSKGAKAFDKCTDSTKDGVGRGIARIVGGLWQMATCWYPVDTDAKAASKPIKTKQTTARPRL